MATSARIDELRKKFEENPRRYFAPLANEYRKAGDPERAVAICEEYLPQQPGHMSGHIVYGQALYELGRNDEARQVFETALSLDPENLIALRHLGDIARTAGDAHAARVWYQRVLEADPRNEEIAQLMMSLLSTPVGSDAVDHTAPTPLNTTAVTPRASTPAPLSAVEAPSPPQPDLDTRAETEAPRVTTSPYTPFPPPPVAPQNFVSRHAPKEEELLDLDSFDLGGVPLSSLRNAKSEASEAEPAAAPQSTTDESDAGFEEFDAQGANASHHDASAPDEPYIEPAEDEPFTEESFVPASFVEQSLAATPASAVEAQHPAPPAIDHDDVGIEKAQEFAEGFEPDAFAIAATPLEEGDTGSFEETPPGTIELAADMDLGLPDDGGSSSTFTTSEEAPVDGLESFEPGFISGSIPEDEQVQTLATESFFDTPAGIEASTPDALVDGFVEDTSAVTGMSAFSQVRDDTTSLPPAEHGIESIDEPVFEDRITSFPQAAEPTLAALDFHEAEPAETQGDPLFTPAFGTEVESAGSHEVEPPRHVGEGGLAELSSSTFDDLESIATPDSVEAEAHVPTPDVSAAAQPGAFVTETMATLYLEQGHFDKALDIYRQLVQQRPDDIALRDRLHAAEERAWGHQRDLGASILDDEPDEESQLGGLADTPASPPRTYGGPTIREFLTGIFHPVSAVAAEEVPDVIDGDTPADPEAVDGAHADVAAMAELPSEDETASTRSGATSPSDSVSSSLGALFAEADAMTHSDHMATPIGGTPAHRAPTELSLNHVFKSNPSQPSNKDAFSFDQFFSEAADEPSTSHVEPVNEAPTDTNDDIAQFNKWLNGLKKS